MPLLLPLTLTLTPTLTLTKVRLQSVEEHGDRVLAANRIAVLALVGSETRCVLCVEVSRKLYNGHSMVLGWGVQHRAAVRRASRSSWRLCTCVVAHLLASLLTHSPTHSLTYLLTYLRLN